MDYSSFLSLSDTCSPDSSWASEAKEKCICTISHVPSRFSRTPVQRVFNHRYGLPAHSPVSSRIQEYQAASPDDAIEALLGRTVIGPIYGKVGRIRSLRFGDLQLHNVMSSFQTGPRHGPSTVEKHGNLGFDAIRRFNVTFDYANERLILVPNSHLSEPFEYNMSGIEYSKTPEGTPKVERFLKDSPAGGTELSEGDLILSIDGRPAGEFGYGERRRVFRQAGATVTLSASSPSGTTKNVTITLRRVI